jgi:hypothetical protein
MRAFLKCKLRLNLFFSPGQTVLDLRDNIPLRHVGVSLLSVVLFCLSGQSLSENASAQTSPPTAAGPTSVAPSLAKAKLADATAAAKKWKADAILIQVQGHVKGDAGTAIGWEYGFYSPATNSCAMITIYPRGPYVSEAREECKSPELKEFMDSDQALKMARNNGVTASEVTMVVMRQADRAIWSVMDERGMKHGNVMLDIDAQTGTLVSKTTQR